jgi:hypothetical protein
VACRKIYDTITWKYIAQESLWLVVEGRVLCRTTFTFYHTEINNGRSCIFCVNIRCRHGSDLEMHDSTFLYVTIYFVSFRLSTSVTRKCIVIIQRFMRWGFQSNDYLLTYSWSWALLEKLPIVQPLKNFPACYGTRRFITAFTRALHWSLSWAISIQSPHPILSL